MCRLQIHQWPQILYLSCRHTQVFQNYIESSFKEQALGKNRLKLTGIEQKHSKPIGHLPIGTIGILSFIDAKIYLAL